MVVGGTDEDLETDDGAIVAECQSYRCLGTILSVDERSTQDIKQKIGWDSVEI